MNGILQQKKKKTWPYTKLNNWLGSIQEDPEFDVDSQQSATMITCGWEDEEDEEIDEQA